MFEELMKGQVGRLVVRFQTMIYREIAMCTPTEAIRIIKKRGDVYVSSQVTDGKIHLFKTIKKEVIALLQGFDKEVLVGVRLIKDSNDKFMDIQLTW